MANKKTETPEEGKKQSKSEMKNADTSKPTYISTVGRRRSAIARVRLYQAGTGDMTVNGKPFSQYFGGEAARMQYVAPFVITDTENKFNITVKVVGGGPNGQLGAVVHGIARALEELDTDKYRALLKAKGLLTRDSRVRQRRMVGMGGKSRRKRQSPKR